MIDTNNTKNNNKKDFNDWSGLKTKINNFEINRWSKPRDIWWCTLGQNIGYEEDGKGRQFLRPVIILKTFGKDTALAVCLTTSEKNNSFHLSVGIIDGVQSFAILSQIKLIDTKRLFEKKGKVDKDIFEKLKKAIKDLI